MQGSLHMQSLRYTSCHATSAASKTTTRRLAPHFVLTFNNRAEFEKNTVVQLCGSEPNSRIRWYKGALGPRAQAAKDAVEVWDGFEYLSDEEVDELISDAAGFISVMDELRPLDPASYNPFYEVWTRIARIPPRERCRLLDELEPGSLRNLWKASMARYVLDEGRSLELFRSVSVWDDFPMRPGQVFVYTGRCERYELEGGGGPAAVRLQPAGPPTFESAAPVGGSAAGPGQPPGAAAAAPWLRPTPASFEVPVTRFTQYFFAPPWDSAAAGGDASAAADGDDDDDVGGDEDDADEDDASAASSGWEAPRVYSRVSLPLVGPLDRWWEPIYCRLRVELTLTPVARDAGADLLLLYPSDPECGDEGQADDAGEGRTGWALLDRSGLPPGRPWPDPAPVSYAVSPFGGGSRDFMRAAGPGVYVGCAYRQGPKPGEYREENFVYFVLARTA